MSATSGHIRVQIVKVERWNAEKEALDALADGNYQLFADKVKAWHIYNNLLEHAGCKRPDPFFERTLNV